MKIAFVTRSLTGGGAERVVSILANAFAVIPEVDEVSVIALIEDCVTYEINDLVRYYANNSLEENKIKRVFQRYSFLRNTLGQIQPDIVISFCTQINIYSILANRGQKGKLIISERNDPNNDPVQKSVRKLRDFIYRFCRAAVFQTPDAKKYFDNIINGKTCVIMNPLKNDIPERFIGERAHKIVSVARLTNVKNHQMLIRAFQMIKKKHTDYILEIYGEGPEKENLIALIKELNLTESVFLRGFCNNVHQEINNAKCFVLASDYEGISNSMLESLGMGIPTICTDCPIGGARLAICNGKNGVLVPVRDQEELIKALNQVIEDEEFANMLSENAVKIKNKLSINNIAKQWLDFILLVRTDDSKGKKYD